MPETNTIATELRALGANETLLRTFGARRAMHFCLVAELDGLPSSAELSAACHSLRAKHPLLGSRIAARSDGPAGVLTDSDEIDRPRFAYHESHTPTPILVTQSGRWTDLVREELSQRVDLEQGPAFRIALHDGGAGGVRLVFVVAHEICDGRGALTGLLDLVAAVNGHAFQPAALPASQEQLFGVSVAARDPQLRAALDEGLARLRQTAAAVRVAELDDSPRSKQVAATTLDSETVDELSDLARQCRVHMHALLTAAVARAAEPPGRRDATVTHPIDLRPVFGRGPDVANRLYGIRTTVDGTGSDLADVARSTQHTIDAARDPQVVIAAGAGLEIMDIQGFEQAARLLHVANDSTVQLSNLGRVHELPEGRIGVRSLAGPFIDTHMPEQELVGAITTPSGLTLSAVSAGDPELLLTRIVRELLAWISRSESSRSQDPA